MKFTIEATYQLPVFRHTTYEADTLEQALEMALADEDWEKGQQDFDSSGETYITGAWLGEHAYQGQALPIPTAVDEAGRALAKFGAAAQRMTSFSRKPTAGPDDAVLPDQEHE